MHVFMYVCLCRYGMYLIYICLYVCCEIILQCLLRMNTGSDLTKCLLSLAENLSSASAGNCLILV